MKPETHSRLPQTMQLSIENPVAFVIINSQPCSLHASRFCRQEHVMTWPEIHDSFLEV